MTDPTPTLTDEQQLAEFLHPWLDGAEWCPYSPTSLCHNHGRSRRLARALLASDLLARMVADAERRALREAADALETEFRNDGFPTQWLRARADRIGGER